MVIGENICDCLMSIFRDLTHAENVVAGGANIGLEMQTFQVSGLRERARVIIS